MLGAIERPSDVERDLRALDTDSTMRFDGAMRLRWLQIVALLPACTPAATPEAKSTTAPSATPTTSTEVVSTPSSTASPPAADGCFCFRHKSDSQFIHGRPLCQVGQKDYQGEICTAGDPAEGPHPPPDLPA